MSKINWATVKTFNHPDGNGWVIYFARTGAGVYVRIDDPRITLAVANVLGARICRPRTLASLREQFGREIATSK